MGNLKRVGRTIIATGGVNTPGLEKLDLIIMRCCKEFVK